MNEGAPRGRGAGINKPAWMVKQEREEALKNKGQDTGGGGDGKDGGRNGENGPRNDDAANGKYADADERGKDERGGGGGNSRGGSRQDRSRSRDGGSAERDQFGRLRGAAGGGGGSRDYDDRRGDGRDYRGGGGGGRRDDYDRRGDRRGGDDYWRDDRRGGGRRDDYDDRRRGGGGGRRDGRRGGGRPPSSGIYFNSYEEERAWLDDRNRKRRARKSLFDIEPTPEQLAEDEARSALEQSHLTRTATGATGANVGLNASGQRYGGGGGRATMQPQQTRHARRIYVGNIPDLSEEDVHNFFRDAIRQSIVIDSSTNANASSHRSQYVENDPIISVYINRERRFAFLEFKTMEITTACLQLDGIDVLGRGKVKVKRPNDYNAALAPAVNPATAPKLNTAALGIVSPTVADGPNKIFIGGLPYHLTEGQVLELLGAFGTVRAFHLVKQDANSSTSKGYCFVEYCDPNVTQVACMGLNGMDMGGGKQLSCRMASQAQSSQGQGYGQQLMESSGGAFGAPVAALPAQASVVDGVDVDALLSAALGGVGAVPPAGNMGPMGSMMMQQPPAMGGVPHQQQLGMNPMGGMMQQQQPQQPMVVADPMAVANAAASALDAAFGGGAPAAVPAPPAMTVTSVGPQVSSPNAPTCVLVLLNMVMDEDLETQEDHKMLEEEVREEAGKYGKLLSMKIPRPQDGYAPSAIKKIFLEYATPRDAMQAEKELKGRAFGPNVVDATYFNEEDYKRDSLK
mmetsp:Transcript_22679/g.47344  ORF Transcript_22679/g.47344 Transcript_22679/m.47344 type:complete len:742 (-) Transcript_22679:558-2783(-)